MTSAKQHSLPPQPADVDSATSLPRLLRDPSFSGLDLAVRAGSVTAVDAVLAALPAGQPPAAAARAAARWAATPAADAAVLQLLLEAGADPLAELLPRLLQRYERSVTAVHQQPFHAQPNRFRAGLAAVLRCQRQQGRGGKNARGISARQHAQLLLAAVFCRDGGRCSELLKVAGDGCWEQHTGNCQLLVAAAEHDMPAVVSALLALRTHRGEQPFSVAPGSSMAHEGCTPLMAAAERNSCAAVRVLLQHGAAVQQTDEDGVSALHWAVIGGSYEAAELLLHHGASPNQVSTAQPDGLHLERPLLTAVKDGNCQLARLLLAHGAPLSAPTECGCTPLSVALAFQQVEAARVLLGLGADAQQVLALDVNGGRYLDASVGSRQLPAGGVPAGAAATGVPAGAAATGTNSRSRDFASLLGLACTRQQQAPLLLELLLDSGADPTTGAVASASAAASGASTDVTPQQQQRMLLPLEEAAAAGAVEGIAHLLHWSQQRHTQLQLGWAAAAAAAARRCLASDSCHEALCLLLDAWQQQQEQQPAAGTAGMSVEARRSIVAALLEAHSEQQAGRAATSQGLDGACEMQAVLLAERLARLGIAADFAAHLAGAPHNRSIILAALPSAQRWTHATHKYFPTAFKAAAGQLLLVAARHQRRAPPAGASLASVPRDALYHVIKLSSEPLSFWLNHQH